MAYATAFGMVAIEREKRIKNLRISIILRVAKKVLIRGKRNFRILEALCISKFYSGSVLFFIQFYACSWSIRCKKVYH